MGNGIDLDSDSRRAELIMEVVMKDDPLSLDPEQIFSKLRSLDETTTKDDYRRAMLKVIMSGVLDAIPSIKREFEHFLASPPTLLWLRDPYFSPALGSDLPPRELDGKLKF